MTLLYLQEHIPALIPSCRALTRIPLTVAPSSGARTKTELSKTICLYLIKFASKIFFFSNKHYKFKTYFTDIRKNHSFQSALPKILSYNRTNSLKFSAED